MSKQFVVGKQYQLEAEGVQLMSLILGCTFKNPDGKFTVSSVNEKMAFSSDIIMPSGGNAGFPHGTLEGQFAGHLVTEVTALAN